MVERPVPQILIKETCLEGITFAQALAVYAKPNGVDVSKISIGPELFFETIDIHSVSEDGQHAVAVCTDEDRFSLVRDGQVVFAGEFKSLFIEAKSADLSRLVVIATGKDKWRSAYFVGSTTSQFLRESKNEIRVFSKSDSMRQILMASVQNGKTRLDIFGLEEDDVSGVGNFYVKGEFYVASLQTTEMPITWKGYRYRWGVPDYDRDYVFTDSKLLAEGEAVSVMVNQDRSRVLTIANDVKKTTIALNGKCLFKGKYLCGRFGVTSELDLAVIELRRKDKKRHRELSQLLILTPEEYQMTESFDKLVDLESIEGGFGIVIKRSGIQRELLITRDGETKEAQPAAETDTSQSS